MEEEEQPDFEVLPAGPFDAKLAFQAWEKMRWIYNLAVGLVGLLVIVFAFQALVLPDIVGAIFYGLMANLFYSLGFLLEMADQHYLKGALGWHRFRIAMFVIGTGLSMLLTLAIGWAYSMVAGLPPAMIDP